MTTRRLLCSIHDVGPHFEAEVDALADRLGVIVGAHRFAMLVVPDHWGQAPLIAGSPFAGRLRRWAESGVEMFVHGWLHRDDQVHDGFRARAKASRMTAGEGEFLGLSEPVALERMLAGRALIEDIIGGPVAGFVAPAWLYGPGARAALPRAAFTLAEDHWRVWNPSTDALLARGPVITWASRSSARARASIAFAACARGTLGGLANVRIGVHPGDTASPEILSSIERTVGRFAGSHQAGRYRDLLDAAQANDDGMRAAAA